MKQRAAVRGTFWARLYSAGAVVAGVLVASIASGAGGPSGALPQRANQPLTVHGKSGMRASISLLGSTHVAVESSSTGALFRGGLAAAGPKRDLEYRVIANGVEDYVHFPERPLVERVSYQLDMSGVAGLATTTSPPAMRIPAVAPCIPAIKAALRTRIAYSLVR